VSTIGFIGLGNIGGQMATRLPHDRLLVHDIREEAAAPYLEKGARFGALKDLAVECDVISIVVLTDQQVRDVVGELLEHATPGTVIAIHSTIDTHTAPELAKLAAGKGVHVVDAPVSGGPMGAAEGTLAVMVGAEREAYEQVKPVFQHWASLVLHVGEAGAGTQCKLARNLITYAGFVAAAEAQRLAEAAGIDLRKLAAVVKQSDSVTGGVSSVMIRQSTAPFAPDDGLKPYFEHARELAVKDLSLAIAMGEQLGVDTPVGRYALEHIGTAIGVPHEEGTA
jgi:3-hydroxyisobutyrate dehydrogenase-like beta-hydroxyacid dehydrogenase